MKIMDDVKAHLEAVEKWVEDMKAHMHAAPKPPAPPESVPAPVPPAPAAS